MTPKKIIGRCTLEYIFLLIKKIPSIVVFARIILDISVATAMVFVVLLS